MKSENEIRKNLNDILTEESRLHAEQMKLSLYMKGYVSALQWVLDMLPKNVTNTFMPCPHEIGKTGDCGHCDVAAPWSDIQECPFKPNDKKAEPCPSAT